jgi:hypothetical protein
MVSEQAKIFVAGFCSAVCLGGFFLVASPQSASGEDAPVLQEVKALRAEVAEFRQEFLRFAETPTVLRPERPEEAREASQIISELRGLKGALLMYYADNMDIGEETLSAAILLSKNNVEALVRDYLDNPSKFNSPEYTLSVVKNNDRNLWLVGRDVSKRSRTVKRFLRGKAKSAQLLRDDGNSYDGGNIVYILVR